MKNQKGVTLISLVTTVILMIMLASITAVTSMNSYNQMRYETFKAKLEEVQRKVDEICEDYRLEKENNSESGAENYTYSNYFTAKFESSPSLISAAISQNGVKSIADKYSLATDSKYIFYFSKDDIKKYFSLEGFDKDKDAIIVDFATRYVYSVEGCKNPEDGTDTTYYTLNDTNDQIAVSKNETAGISSSNSIDVISSKKVVGSTTMYNVTLKLIRDTTGRKYSIKKAYYKEKESDSWVEVDYLGDCKYTDDTVSFIMYKEETYSFKEKTYSFKIEDTFGKLVEKDSVEIK